MGDCKLIPNWSKDGFELEDGEALHEEAPQTFLLPDFGRRSSLKAGDLVKLAFRIHLETESGQSKCEVERMWVIVKEVHPTHYIGILDNDPVSTDGMKSGLELGFLPKHVIDIYEEG